MKNIITSVVIGSLFGGIISRFLFVGSFLNLLLWGIVAILLAFLAREKKSAFYIGSFYGFFLFLAFVISGYNGSASFVSRIPFFTAIGCLGAFFGIITTFLGYMIWKLMRKLLVKSTKKV